MSVGERLVPYYCSTLFERVCLQYKVGNTVDIAGPAFLDSKFEHFHAGATGANGGDCSPHVGSIKKNRSISKGSATTLFVSLQTELTHYVPVFCFSHSLLPTPLIWETTMVSGANYKEVRPRLERSQFQTTLPWLHKVIIVDC